jgi:hypothetical protein
MDEEFLADNRDIPDVLGGTDDVAQQAAQTPVPSAMLTVETLETTFAFLFDFIAELAGEGGEFWRLKELQKRELAKVWLPIVGPWLDAMGESKTLMFLSAALATGMILVPRVKLEVLRRRASKTVDMVMAKSGDSSSSPVPQAQESPSKPTGSLLTFSDA